MASWSKSQPLAFESRHPFPLAYYFLSSASRHDFTSRWG